MAKNPNKDTEVIISFPDKIGIALVQSNELKIYELFQWLIILLAPIAVGFWTAYFTVSGYKAELFWSALVFTTMTIIFIVLSLIWRKKVYRGSINKTASLKDFT